MRAFFMVMFLSIAPFLGIVWYKHDGYFDRLNKIAQKQKNRFELTQKIRQDRLVDRIPEFKLLLKKVGWVTLGRKRSSSFYNFSLEKKESTVIRIGAFGDSNTWGAETRGDQDYPFHLQQLFNASGITNVEVINFGSSWHGFHQTFSMWNDLAERYDLDFVLLGPGGFQAERDTRFNHTQNYFPNFLHGRYVLDGGRLRYIPVRGQSWEDMFKNYYGLVPTLDYLRFDREAPAFIKAWSGFHEVVFNPFYYFSGSEKRESLLIYREMLKQISGSNSQVILFHEDFDIVALARGVAKLTSN